MFIKPLMLLAVVGAIGMVASRSLLAADGIVETTTPGSPAEVYDRIVDERTLLGMFDTRQAELVGNWGAQKRFRTMVPEGRIDRALLPADEGDITVTVDVDRARSIRVKAEFAKSRRSFVVSSALAPAATEGETRFTSRVAAFDAKGNEVEPDAQVKTFGEYIGRALIGLAEDRLLAEQRRARPQG